MHNFGTVRMALQCIAGESISEMENKKKKIIKAFREAINSLQKLLSTFQRLTKQF